MEIEPDSLPQIVEALIGLLRGLEATFGPDVTLLLVIGTVVLGICWRVYQQWLESKEVNLALEEKERTIQRLAAVNRELRILVYKEVHKWSDEQVQRFILLNEPPDGPSARRQLEGPDAPVATEGSSGISKPKSKSAQQKRSSR
jgi:hypothetical protein